MPRTRDPNEAIDQFQALLQASLDTFQALVDATKTEALHKRIALDTYLHAAVGFETFRSEWHLACINRDPALFKAAVRASVAATLRGGRHRGAANHVTLVLARYPSMQVIRAIVDPDGRNIAFPTVDDWQRRAREETASRFADRVDALTADEFHVVTAVAAIRNCIAHRSSNSAAEMNRALAAVPAGLRRGKRLVRVDGLGSYLWASSSPGVQRDPSRT